MGHGHEMATGSGLTLELDSASLPLFEGALDFARDGLLSGGAKRGRANLEGEFDATGVDDTLLGLMFDAETSGGLLIAIHEGDVEPALKNLEASGCFDAREVGGFFQREEVVIRVG